MDAIEQLQQEVREGRIDLDRLVGLVVTLQRQLQGANQQLQAANRRIEELENQSRGSGPAKLEQPFSLRAEEQRQEARGKNRKRKKQGRRGRITTADKIAQAVAHEDV